MLKIIKNIFLILATILVIPFALVLFLIALIGTGIWYGWKWMFRKLRRDPIVRIEEGWVRRDNDVETYEGDEGDKKYFDSALRDYEFFTEKLAEECGGSVRKIVRRGEKWKSDEHEETTLTRMLRVTRWIKSPHGKARATLPVEHHKRADGEELFYTTTPSDDVYLTEGIHLDMRLDGIPDHEFCIRVANSDKALEFCVALLSGGGWLSEESGQLWAWSEKYKVWMVKYKTDDIYHNEIGFRKKKSAGKARQYWFDSK